MIYREPKNRIPTLDGQSVAKKLLDFYWKDILEAVEEGIRLTPCCASDTVLADKCVRLADCRATRFWNGANEYVMKYFESYSLARVIKEYDSVNSALLAGSA